MMAVESIVNLAQALADQLSGLTLNSQAGASTPGTGRAGKLAITEDTFTPSTQSNSARATAQDAGIFQVSQGALTAVTANILFARANPNAAHGRAPAQAASFTTTNAGNAQPVAAKNPNIPVIAGELIAATPAAQVPTPEATPTTNEQVKIQALNASLPALGLSKVEIQEIDRLATRIQNFNPAAYTDLVNQFEALAQQATQPNAANAAANGSTVGSQNTPASAKAIGGSSQA
jgi:hypothetical protein